MLLRHTLNGVIATLIHYAIFEVLVQVAAWESKGLANSTASIIAIACSFFGNKFYVFKDAVCYAPHQIIRFVTLYLAVATINGVFMFVWADLLMLDYRVVFLLTLIAQFALTYLGNRHFVFVPFNK